MSAEQERFSVQEENFFYGVMPVLCAKECLAVRIPGRSTAAADLLLRTAKTEVAEARRDKKFFVYGRSIQFSRETATEIVAAHAFIIPGSKLVANQGDRVSLILDGDGVAVDFEFSLLQRTGGFRGQDFDVFAFVDLPGRFRDKTDELLRSFGRTDGK